MPHTAVHADWSRPYRIVQWATGNVGVRALRRVIEHPGLELVGVWVHSAAKVGRDAGELAGIEPVGIRATDSIDDVIALKPDCVLYMPHENSIDDVCRLLEAGINISSTRMEFQNPAGLDPADRERVLAACLRGRSSIHADGSNPGFLSEALPLVLTSLSRRLDCLTITEYADTSHRNSPEMVFGPMMGFGAKPGNLNQAMMHHMEHSFIPSLSLITQALGLSFDRVEVTSAQGLAREDTQIAAGLVPAGTVAATRTMVSAYSDGKPLINFAAIWYVARDVDTSDGEDWNIQETGWQLLIEGDTPIEVSVRFPLTGDLRADSMPNYTAHRPINAIPYVCAAAPGFATTVDLPQIVARLA